MRTSSLIAVLMVGIFTLSNAVVAKPILDFNLESVYNSRFCKTYGCRFNATGSVSFGGIELDQFLYRLKNGLYFVTARWIPHVDLYNRPGRQVTSVSLMARATPRGLKQLEVFLPQFIDGTAFGRHFDFKYDFKRKCAEAARFSFNEQPSNDNWEYKNFGFFETILLPGSQNLTQEEITASGRVYGRKTLTIACTPQPFNMLSITLFWEDRSYWGQYSFGFSCSDVRRFSPACPWAYLKTVPMRI